MKNRVRTRLFNKIVNKFVVGIISLVCISTFVLQPIPVHASGIPTVDIAAIAQRTSIFVKDQFDKVTDNFLDELAATFWNNGVQQFVNNLVIETATWVASGDEGQKPLLFTNDWQDYMQNAGEEAVASMAIGFADSVGLGNICMSPEIAIDLVIPQLKSPKGTKPRCSLEALKKTWDVRDPKFLENVTFSFQTDQNDLGIAFSFLAEVEGNKQKEIEAASKEREASIFKPVKDAISGLTKTPAPLVEKALWTSSDGTTKTVYTYKGNLVADSIGLFVGTLMGQYFKKLQNGFFSLADLRSGSDDDLQTGLSLGRTGKEGSREQYSGFFKPSITQPTDFSILSDLQSCPSEVQFSNLYNCSMDAAFAQALNPAGDSYLTVQQAVDAGVLHGNWDFGYSDPGNGTEPSYLNGYAHSAMKKLRKLRIIPVGWEIAAQRSRDLSRHMTLQEVLNEFNELDSDFVNLVDPDWVLKVPPLTCTAKVPGEMLTPKGKDRMKTCVDIKDCVVMGDNGECLSWGYCTNEKRTWHFPSDKCEEEFATCEKFIKKGENLSDNLWLSSTIDNTGCTAQSAGCKWYSYAQDAENDWIEDIRLYLNSFAESCNSTEAGCHEYISMRNGNNLLQNSSFEDDGGNQYALGLSDSEADNGIPDGWLPKQVEVSLSEDAIDGGISVQLVSSAGANCNPGLQYTAPLGTFEVGQTYVLSGWVKTDSESSLTLKVSFQNIPYTVTNVSQTWKAFAFSFIMPATSNNYSLLLRTNDGDCANLNQNINIYYDAIQLEQGLSVSEYDNYGVTDRLYLQNAPACTFEEVGCQHYIPKDSNLGIETTAIATGVDLCPKECVGYANYEQKETELEDTQFVDFIARSADKCSAVDVGCERFTNLDTVDKGGEGSEYYSSIRHCEKPQPQCATFFAWEGSDVTGFQLISYSLFTNTPDASGSPATTDNSTTCDPGDFNCRELIAEDGTRYIRDLDVTITCSDQCVPLRAPANFVTQSECEAKMGEWEVSTERCLYQAISAESQVCPAKSVGCREYLGNTGHNVATIYTEDFEQGTAVDWDGGIISTESIVVGGHSLKLGDQANAINATTSVFIKDVVPGKSYILEFSAKSSVSDFLNVTAWLGESQNADTRLGGFVNTNSSWNHYQLGPVRYTGASTTVPLVINVQGSSTKPEDINLFLDTILIRQIQDSVYLVKNSWDTPETCDTNPPLAGGSASRSMVGCQQYRVDGDTNNEPQYLKSFTRLCSEEKVGCEAVIDTFNSTEPYRKIWQADDLAEIIVPADSVTYLVNRNEFKCNQRLKGCTALGSPNLDQDYKVVDYFEVYYKVDPDRFGSILCKDEALRCEEYTTSTGSTVYAKDPLLKQCEYTTVPESLPTWNAWFKIGDTENINPDKCLDAEKNDYVRRCPSTQISCTEFYEPITGSAYYYKKNNLKNTGAECNGVVNWKQGCVLFNDLSVKDKYFKSGDDNDYVGAPGACQTGDLGCDSNTLLKVWLDRDCSEWLMPVSTSRYWDRFLQTYRTTSYSLGRCIEADPINPNLCRKWNNTTDKEPLDLGFYQARDTEWGSADYTGYSIPFEYPMETLRQYNTYLDEDNQPQGYRLSHLTVPPNQTLCNSNIDCPQSDAIRQVCKFDLDPESGNFEGKCYINDGLGLDYDYAESQCRGYPEEDSPFPSHLAKFAPSTDIKNPGQITSKDPLFANANIGQEDEDVECKYSKVTYQGDTRYYGIDTDPPSTIIIDGDDVAYTRKDNFLGWEGYCIEFDDSRKVAGDSSATEPACLSWYPVDVILGARDLNNMDVSAGYLASDQTQFYCMEAIFGQYLTTYTDCAACKSPYYTTITARSAKCDNPYTAPDMANVLDRELGGLNSTEFDILLGTVSVLTGGISNLFDFALKSIFGIGLGEIVVEIFGTDQYPKVTCIPTYGDGWYPMIYPLYHPDDPASSIVCGALARIQNSAGRNRAWTTRIRDENFEVLGIGWTIDQITPPFGAARPETLHPEELGEPLMLRLPSSWAMACRLCNEGICKDEDPDRNGKYCPAFPNAGAPYALGTLWPQWINDSYVPIRADNALPTEGHQPYRKDETSEDGKERLQELFAKSYGTWKWIIGFNSVCVGSCGPGVNSGQYCDSDAFCGDIDRNVSYECVNPNLSRTVDGVQGTYGICVGGTRHSQDCISDSDCVYDAESEDYKCVETDPDDPNANYVYACNNGPFKGGECEQDIDCLPFAVNGICDYSLKRCQGSIGGEIVWSSISGQECTSTAECNAEPLCRVERCSTQIGETDVNLCSDDAVAGDACGDSLGKNQYIQYPFIGWDLIEDDPQVVEKPIIQPVVANPEGIGVTEGYVPEGGFSVNRVYSGVIAAQDGRAPVNVSFYAYNANGEQLPLRVALVDWADGTDPAISTGAFKNHKHICKRACSNAPGISCRADSDCLNEQQPDATCDPVTWGDSPDACVEDYQGDIGYFDFSHTYTCAGPESCTFKPRVLVQDNWGATVAVEFAGQIVVEPPLN